MKRKSYVLPVFALILSLSFYSNMSAQVYNGDLTISSQAQIDTFNYTTINGGLYIAESIPGNIVNLKGLSELKTIRYGFGMRQNTALTNVNGLSNLDSVGSDFILSDNPVLSNVDGFSNLNYVGGYFEISENPLITNLDGFSNLSKIVLQIYIYSNNALTNINGISNLTPPFIALYISNNNALTDINGISNYINQVQELGIANNTSLSDINVLSKLTNLWSLNLSNLAIQNLNALSNLQSAHFLDIKNNASLANIDSLINLKEIGHTLRIEGNNAITNIDGLENLIKVGGAENTDSLIIRNNSSLTRFCGLYPLFSSGTAPVTVKIIGNVSNPTPVEITNAGPCSSFTVNTYEGNLVLKSQFQIDTLNFYTMVTGDVIVDDSLPGNITNLNGLSEFTSIGGGLYILNNNSLANLDSLANLSGARLIHIRGNGALTNIDGLLGITGLNYFSQIPTLVISGNNALINIDGLRNITQVNGGIEIDSNGVLENIDGLSGITSIPAENYLWIDSNPALTDVDGLSNLNYAWHLLITGNSALQNIYGLGNLRSAGSIDFISNGLSNLDGLSDLDVIFLLIDRETNLTNVNSLKNVNISFLRIVNAPNLENINGLSLHSFPRALILSNTGVRNLDPLTGVRSVDYLELTSNKNLTNIDGLINLTQLGEDFEDVPRPNPVLNIADNPVLTNLKGLRRASLRRPHSNRILSINNNPLLTEFCGIYGLIYYNSQSQVSNLDLHDNGENPTASEILANGPCEAGPGSFIATLLGSNETPPVTTDGSGGGMFKLNNAKDTLHFWIRICSLECPLTAAYFYTGIPGDPGFVVKTITGSFLPDTLGYVAQGIWTSSDNQPLTPHLVDELFAGNIFVNIHSTSHPLGEIRGQLTNNVPVNLYANLDGLQETPPVMASGSGVGSFWLTGDGDSLMYDINVADLSDAISAAHFHKGAFGVPGPVVKPVSFVGDSTSSGWWTNTDAQPLTPALVADLLGCFLYVNIHTSNHPAGEIRGQIYKTIEVPLGYMTVWAAENDSSDVLNSKLTYYSLEEGRQFYNSEGEIYGYDGKRNIVDLTIDVGGNIYFLNNTWASMLYRITPYQLDFNPATSVFAKQMGRLRTADDKLIWISGIQFIKGKLYGVDNKTNKFYEINPFNAVVREIVVLNLESLITGFVSGADGNVYVLKTTAGENQVWKFDKFPPAPADKSVNLSFVTTINSLDKLESFASHPNGRLYASDKTNLYEINLADKSIGMLSGHRVDIAAMDFDYYTERNMQIVPTMKFEDISGVTAVGGFTGAPTEYSLSQNYPNPFNPNTVIRYELPEAQFVRLTVYNSLGEVVRTLVNEVKNAGYYETIFDAEGLSSGMYIYRLEAGSFVSSSKMILIK